FVTYQADHGHLKAISSVPYEYMLTQTPGQIEAAQNNQGAQASPKHASQLSPTYEGATQDTMVIKGGFAGNLLPLPDGQLAFTSFAEDGNHLLLRIIDGLHVRKSLLL